MATPCIADIKTQSFPKYDSAFVLPDTLKFLRRQLWAFMEAPILASFTVGQSKADPHPAARCPVIRKEGLSSQIPTQLQPSMSC